MNNSTNSVSFDDHRIYTTDKNVLKIMELLDIKNNEYAEPSEINSSDLSELKATILGEEATERQINELDDVQPVDATIISSRDDIRVVEGTLIGSTRGGRKFMIEVTEKLQEKFDKFNVEFVYDSEQYYNCCTFTGNLYSALEGEVAHTCKGWFKSSVNFRSCVKFLNPCVEDLFQQAEDQFYANEALGKHEIYEDHLNDVKRLKKALRIADNYNGTHLFKRLEGI